MGFSEKQVSALKRGLSAAHIRTRELTGRTLSYIEGWHAIAEANRIFGFDGWDRETVESKCVLSRDNRGSSFQAVYLAKVRISVRAKGETVVREGYGSGEAHGSSAGETHEKAVKTAETDATKRALATFGKPFGLSLYVSSRKSHVDPAPIENPLPEHPPIPEQERRRTQQRLGPNGRYTTVPSRPQVLEPTFEAGRESVTSLASLTQGIDGLNGGGTAPKSGAADADSPGGAPDLPCNQEQASATMPMAQLQDVVATIAEPGSSAEGSVPQSPSEPTQGAVATAATLVVPTGDSSGALATALPAVGSPPLLPTFAPPSEPADKASEARLLIDWPKRRREPEHLKYVGTQPCLLCGRAPSDAHHLRFAQRRALGRKVSDEFTVPLCRVHHRQLHQAGKETDWWAAADKDVDPLNIARELWEESRKMFNRPLEP